MAKRFSETDIWKKQRWFRKLSPEYKLAFFYIKDQCNHAGIWDGDCNDLIDDLGIPCFLLNDFIKECNTEYDKESGVKKTKERIKLLDKGYVWVTGFFQFQYEGKEGKVNPYAAPVRTALQILMSVNMLNYAIDNRYVTLTEPFHEGMLRPKEKEKDKDNNTLLKVKQYENGEKNKPIVNFKAQGEVLFAGRIAGSGDKANNNGQKNNPSEK